MKKTGLLALMLVCIMLFGTLVSCGGDQSDDTGSSSVSGTSGDAADGLVLPSEGFGGEDFTILVSGHTSENNAFNDFGYAEENPDAVDSAIHKRNMLVEEQLDVKIITIEDFEASPKTKSMIVKNHTSGDCLYDAVLPIAYDVSSLAYDGKLSDLNSLSQYLNLENDWWDQKANEDLEMNGIMFFTTGDFSVWANEVTACITFNKTLADDNGIGASNLYTLASEGKWTYDELINAAKKCHNDLDGSQSPSLGDLYGLVTWDDAIYSVVNSIGVKCASVGEDGKMKLTLNSERTVSVITKYIEFCKQDDTVINFQYTTAASHNEAIMQTFGDNKGLFLMIMFKNLSAFRDTQVEYGILPYPKFDENQEEYYNSIAPWHVNYLAVPAIISDADKSGAVLEALCYKSTDTVVTAYYDKTLIGKTVRDEESAPMLDIIFDTRIFDVGYYYEPGQINKKLITELVRKDSTDFASMYAQYEPAATAALEKINYFFQETFATLG